MNLYFSSVFTHEQSDLPEFDNMIYDNLSHILCTSSEVEKHLKALNIHKSPGPDLISPHILKECALELSTSLCVLFNKSFSTGMLPADWKIANITPIHKKGNKHKKENYRQISLTSIVCKIAKKIVRSRITTFWSTHHVLNPNQFAWLLGRKVDARTTFKLFPRRVLIQKQLENNRCHFPRLVQSIRQCASRAPST